MPEGKVGMMVAVDPETLAWYQSQGPAWDERIVDALRSYAQAHGR